MEIVKENKKGVVLLHLSGYMVADTIDSFKKVVNGFRTETENKIILDMENVKMIDSSGIGAIAFMLKRFRLTGGDVKIANTPKHIVEIFRMIRLDKTVDMYSSLDDAVRNFY